METGTAEMLIAGKANSSECRTRERLIRSVIQSSLVFTLGLPAFLLSNAESALGQQCDTCKQHSAPHVAPTCGCESKSALLRPSCDSSVSSKACSHSKVCEPTFAEKFLRKVDKLGDEFEAKHGLNKPAKAVSFKKSPTCGCETSSVSGPTCGCETSSVTGPTCGCETSVLLPRKMTIIRPIQPFPNVPPSLQSIGKIGDQSTNLPPIVQAKPTQSSSIPPSTHSKSIAPQATASSAPKLQAPPLIETPPSLKPIPTHVAPVPSQQETLNSSENSSSTPPPFKERTPSVEPPPRRLPPDEQLRDRDMVPAPPPIQKTPALPPKTDPNLPDVLVDPFKDDSTTMSIPGTDRGIRLTTSNPNLKNDAANVVDATAIRTSSKIPFNSKLRPKSKWVLEPRPVVVAPEKLTPKQRDVVQPDSRGSILEIGPTTSSQNHSSGVVSSAYHEVVPQKNSLRDVPSGSTPE